MRLLLAEDNRELAHWLEKALVQNGFAVDCVFDGLAADHLLHSETYALAVLDINMPGLDGLEVVQRLRKRGQTLPVLLLTARSAVADRVKGLNVGADDYLAKPFEIEELDAGAARGRYKASSNWGNWRFTMKAIFSCRGSRWRSRRANRRC